MRANLPHRVYVATMQVFGEESPVRLFCAACLSEAPLEREERREREEFFCEFFVLLLSLSVRAFSLTAARTPAA